jgi:hypothetical protein
LTVKTGQTSRGQSVVSLPYQKKEKEKKREGFSYSKRSVLFCSFNFLNLVGILMLKKEEFPIRNVKRNATSASIPSSPSEGS